MTDPVAEMWEELENAKAEIERLRAENLTLRNVGITQLDETERLRAERDHWHSLVSRADRMQFPFLPRRTPL